MVASLASSTSRSTASCAAAAVTAVLVARSLQAGTYIVESAAPSVVDLGTYPLALLIGALCGLRTRGGADAVGRSTTASVVAAIFAIIVADASCSLLFYFGD